MSSVRLSRRKRSSIAAGMPIAPAKPGFYGVQKPVQFAPNVTPGTYVAPEDEELDLSALPNEDDDSQALFPPSSEPAPAPSRRRVPPHKRRSLGYIPRPPNAFMLFRAHFVRQRHVPGTIETNHGSLSKIIGNVWNDLPPEERKLWENRAKIEKAAHKAKYPDYRFRPVHNKNKKKQKAAAAAAAAASSSHITSSSDNSAETVRCEKISALLMTGKKGEELAAAVAQLDHEQLLQRQQQHQQFFANGGALAQPAPSYPQQQSYLAPPQFQRRPSSVPLPIYPPGFYGFETTQEPGIALPSLNTNFFPISQSSSNSPGPADPSRPMSAVAMPYQHQMQEMQFVAPNPSHADANSFLQPWPMQFNSRMSISNPQMALGLGLRRASSTSAIQNVANNHHVQFGGFARNWEFNYGGNEMPMQSLDGGMGLQRDDEPLPEVNNSLWEPSFALNAATGSGPSPPPTYESYGASPLEKPTHSRSHSQNHMDPIAPHEVLHPVDTTMQYQQHQAMSASASPASSMSLPELDQYSWMTPVNTNGAVAGGEGSAEVAVLAPQPTPLTAAFAALENYEHTQTVDEMWQWQGFAQGDVGHKGDGVPLEALFQNDGSFEIDAYMA